MGIAFITLWRRGPKLLEEIEAAPASAWRRVELKSLSCAYRSPRVLDRRIELRDYEGPIRQLAITELGHKEPTQLVTNQLRRGASGLIDTYARRMLIESSISDGVDFFHMDALSSVVAMKRNCDLQLTLMGSSLYRLTAPASAAATQLLSRATYTGTSSRPRPRSPSPKTTSRCALASEPTTPTCSPPALPTPTLPFPGGRAAGFGWRSVERKLRGVRSRT